MTPRDRKESMFFFLADHEIHNSEACLQNSNGCVTVALLKDTIIYYPGDTIFSLL